jgi:hypothetical protein
MKKTYSLPITILENQILTEHLLDNSNPHVNDEGNVEFPGGEGEGGDAYDRCVKEINEIETDTFKDGLW